MTKPNNIAASAALALCGCATNVPVAPPGAPVGTAPYVAVQKPLPPDKNRIYVLAALPGRIVFRSGCVLFERLDRKLVLPIFEAGVIAGRDGGGEWLYDPASNQYFREGTLINAGAGGSPDSIDKAVRRLDLRHPIPSRCKAAVSEDSVLILNPGLRRANFDD